MNVALRPNPIRYGSICTGGGGLDLGFELAFGDARPAFMVEREAFAAAHLVSAMQSGLMAKTPLWSDAKTFNGRPWRGAVDCLIGGIPCQPHSAAGLRLGEDDERDLWPNFRRILVQSGAPVCLIENVAGMLTASDGRMPGAERVRRDLQRLGFVVEGGLFSAAEVGASHERARVFILAVADLGNPTIPRLHAPAYTGTGGSDEIAGPRDAQPERRSRELGYPHEPVIRKIAPAGKQPESEFDEGTGRKSIFPPGPNDLDGWRECLTAAPEFEPSTSQETIESIFCDLADGLARRLDGDIYDQKIRPHKALSLMWRAAVSQAYWETIGRPWGFSETKILRSLVHGAGDDQRRCDALSDPEKVFFFKEECVRSMWLIKEFASTPQGQKLAEQFTGKPSDLVCELSHITSPQKWGHKEKKTAAAVRHMWEAFLPTLRTALQYMPDTLAPRNESRTDRLRLLGNGVVPLQAAYAIRTLVTRLAARGSPRATELVRMMEMAA